MGQKKNHEHKKSATRRGAEAPGGEDFLDLEISKVLYDEARQVTRDAFRELLKDAVKTLLRERFGEQLQALATLAADELADDIEANLEIEAKINARAACLQEHAKRVRVLFQGDDRDEPDPESPHPGGERDGDDDAPDPAA